MVVKLHNEISGSNFNESELMSYLSQVVLNKIDDDVVERNKTLENYKLKLEKSKGRVKEIKKISEELTHTLSKEKALSRVLSLVSTLIKEGVLRGGYRAQVLKVLNEIEKNKFDFHGLRNVEEKLSVLLPDKIRS